MLFQGRLLLQKLMFLSTMSVGYESAMAPESADSETRVFHSHKVGNSTGAKWPRHYWTKREARFEKCTTHCFPVSWTKLPNWVFGRYRVKAKIQAPDSYSLRKLHIRQRILQFPICKIGKEFSPTCCSFFSTAGASSQFHRAKCEIVRARYFETHRDRPAILHATLGKQAHAIKKSAKVDSTRILWSATGAFTIDVSGEGEFSVGAFFAIWLHKIEKRKERVGTEGNWKEHIIWMNVSHVTWFGMPRTFVSLESRERQRQKTKREKVSTFNYG